MQAVHDPYGALRHRDFRRLLSGSMLFSLGTDMQAVAVGWELYLRTKSAAPFAFAGLAQFLPVLLLALPAGHAADRYNPKKVLMLAQSLGGLTSLGLAALSYWSGPIDLIYGCLLMVGVARAFSVPGRWALFPQVVPVEDIPNAVTWYSSGFQLATVAGPALGGWVLSIAPFNVVYLLTATCALSCVALVSTIKNRATTRPKDARNLRTFLAGFRFVWQTKPILAAITLDLFAVLLGGATALLPMYAKDILDVGPVGLGWLRAAPGLGAFVVAILIAHRPPSRHAGKALLLAVTGFGIATIVFGVSTSFPLSFAMLLVAGGLDNISVVVRGTLVQTLTPEAMRGRVGAVNFVFVSSSNDLGAFESGLTAYYFGPVASVVMGGVGTVLVVIAVMARWPTLSRLSLSRAAVNHAANAHVAAEDVEETLAPPG